MVGIYSITSPSRATYIGQSHDIQHRFKAYKRLACKDQPRIYNSLLKYGSQNHNFEILLELRKDIQQSTLDYLEILFMEQFRNEGIDLMNIKAGGSYGRHSKETKAKLSSKLKGRKLSAEHAEKIRARQLNMSEHTKSLISKNHADLSMEKHPLARPILQYSLNGQLIKEWSCTARAAMELKVSAPIISMCLNGHNKTGHGYIWKFKEKKDASIPQ